MRGDAHFHSPPEHMHKSRGCTGGFSYWHTEQSYLESWDTRKTRACLALLCHLPTKTQLTLIDPELQISAAPLRPQHFSLKLHHGTLVFTQGCPESTQMQTALVALATAGILPDGPRTSLTSAVLLTHSGIFVHVIFVSIFCHVVAAMWVPEPTLVGPKILVSLKAIPSRTFIFPISQDFGW